MPPAYKHHSCVTWSPKCLQRQSNRQWRVKRGECTRSALKHVSLQMLMYQPVQVRYLQAHPPAQTHCHPQCPEHKALDSSYWLVPLPSPHGRQTAPPAGLKKQKHYSLKVDCKPLGIENLLGFKTINSIYFHSFLFLHSHGLLLVSNRRQLWWLGLQPENEK